MAGIGQLDFCGQRENKELLAVEPTSQEYLLVMMTKGTPAAEAFQSYAASILVEIFGLTAEEIRKDGKKPARQLLERDERIWREARAKCNS